MKKQNKKQPALKSLKAAKKIVDTLSGKALTGLTVGDKVIYQGKEHDFCGYRDYGFTAMIKPRGAGSKKEFLVFGSQIERHLHYPPKLNEEQKKKLQKFLNVFLNYKKIKSWEEFQELARIADKDKGFDRTMADFVRHHICSIMARDHKALTKIIQNG